MKIDIPDKLFFKIGEVSKLADVAPHTVRYWESEFSQIKPNRTKSGQRLYRQEDVKIILKIKDLLHNQGFTTEGARNFLESEHLQNSAVLSTVKPLSISKNSISALQQIKAELKELQSLVNKGQQKAKTDKES